MTADLTDLEIIGDLDRRATEASPGLLLPVYRRRSNPDALFIDRDAAVDGWPVLAPVPSQQLDAWRDEGRFTPIAPPIHVARGNVLVMLDETPEYLPSEILEERLEGIFVGALDEADRAFGAARWETCERALVRCAHARHGDPLIAAAMVALARHARPTAARALLKQAIPRVAALRSHRRWHHLAHLSQAITRDPDLAPLLARGRAPQRPPLLPTLSGAWPTARAAA
ncbi:MAG TPA: hypothetical protein PKA64_03475 [Myxococcota bacterium]|nr:hypothetical protein [Myxococcota bacterium]